MYWKSIVGACSLALASGIVASAYTGEVAVKVPFTFEVSGRQLPAGSYLVSEPGTNGIVYVHGEHASVMALSAPAPQTRAAQTALVFERVGGKEHLIGVQTESAGARSILSHLASK